MTRLRWIYLSLAILGALVALRAPYFQGAAGGPGLTGVLMAWAAGKVAAPLFREGAVSVATLAVWVLTETWTRKNWSALWALPAALFIGVSCGLPLYLFLRTRPIV